MVLSSGNLSPANVTSSPPPPLRRRPTRKKRNRIRASRVGIRGGGRTRTQTEAERRGSTTTAFRHKAAVWGSFAIQTGGAAVQSVALTRGSEGEGVRETEEPSRRTEGGGESLYAKGAARKLGGAGNRFGDSFIVDCSNLSCNTAINLDSPSSAHLLAILQSLVARE